MTDFQFINILLLYSHREEIYYFSMFCPVYRTNELYMNISYSFLYVVNKVSLCLLLIIIIIIILKIN